MLAYVDCIACACLIRATEPSCPFCGVSRRHAPAPPSRVLLGLTLGLGLSVFGCGDKEGDEGNDDSAVTVDPTHEADAVTYAGPDPWSDTDTDSGVATTTTTTDPGDSQEADAVTYAGPDETTSIGGETFSATDSGTTDAGTTTTGDTDGTMSGTDTGSSSSSG